MKQKRYRAVVIGCGKIGALFEAEPRRPKPGSHAGALVSNPRTELVALVDTSPENLAKAGKLFPRAALYASFTECLKKERPDIVVIATPPQSRLAIIRACMKSGVRMILCEKPLALDSREANAIRKLLARSGVVFVVNYQRRFSPLFKRVRDDIRKGMIGRIQQATCYYSNGLRNNGGHIVDAVMYLFQDNIVSVSGIENKKSGMHPVGDSNIDGMLTTTRGTTIALQSFDQGVYAINDICILGEKGAITLTDFGQRGIWRFAGSSSFVGVRQLSSSRAREHTEPLSATKGALQHVIESFEHHRTPTSGVTNGGATLRVIDALRRSAKSEGKRGAV